MPRSPSQRRRAITLALVSTLGLIAAACTGPRPELADTAESTSSTTVPASTTAAASLAEVAQANSDAIDVFADASSADPERQITAGEATSAPNVPIVFLVKSRTGDRLEVYLPVPPSGSSGWVRTEDVTVSTVPYRIEVALAAHRVRVFDGDEVVVDEPMALGQTDRPAPGGTYYLKELLQPPDPSGTYGTYAYGLSGFSTVLSSFNGDQGVVGIHGTNDPTSIGQDVPRGCIGLDNAVIARLVHEIGLPLGTPVEILE